MKEAGLSSAYIKAHFLRIGGATAYENSAATIAATEGFVGFWFWGAIGDHSARTNSSWKKAAVAVGRESKSMLVVRQGPVSGYAEGITPAS